MEKSLDSYIRRLVELDSKAIVLRGEKDEELFKQETQSRDELKRIGIVVEEAAAAAKQRHDEIIGDARLQANEINRLAVLKINELQAAFSSFKGDAARDIWMQLLEIER